VGTQVHEECLVALPAEQDAQIVIDAERPVSVKVALELARSEQGILRVDGEAFPEDPATATLWT